MRTAVAALLAALALIAPARAANVCAWMLETNGGDDGNYRQLEIWLQSDADVDFLYKIGGKGILLTLRVAGCPHMLKEQLLRESGIKPYSCLATNMILDQLIEKLGYATTYVADLKVDEEKGECVIRAAIYATPEKIGEVSDWSKE